MFMIYVLLNNDSNYNRMYLYGIVVIVSKLTGKFTGKLIGKLTGKLTGKLIGKLTGKLTGYTRYTQHT